MPHDGYARAHQRADLRQESAFELDGPDAAFPDKARRVGKRCIRPGFIRHKRHVRNDEGVMYSLHNRAAMMDHFIQGDRQGVFAPEHDHTEGIAHQHHIDPGPIHNTGGRRIVRGDHSQLPPVFGIPYIQDGKRFLVSGKSLIRTHSRPHRVGKKEMKPLKRNHERRKPITECPERQNTGGGPYFTVEGGAATLPASGESCPEPFPLEPLMSNYTELLQRIEQEPSTWLVTGVAGFIGSNLLQTLLSHGQRVVGLDNFLTGYQHNLDMVRELVTPEQWERFRFIEGDIRDVETCLQACQGVEHVLHEAALGSVPRSIENPIMTNGCNIDGFLNMLVAARDCGVKSFVYAASSSTYGDEPNLPKQEDRIGKPLSPYAVTKYVNELYAEVFARSYGFKTIGLRYFNVFGQRQDPYGAYAAVIPQWFAALTKGDTVYVNGDGETSRDFCYIDNVVQANLLASYAADDARNLVYNVAFGQRTTLNELFRLIRDEVVRHKPEAAEAKPAYRDFRAGDVRHSLADITRARTLLGYEPEYDVRQGLRLAGDWYDAHL